MVQLLHDFCGNEIQYSFIFMLCIINLFYI